MKIHFAIGLLVCGAADCAHAGWERLSPSTITLTGEIGRSSFEEYSVIAIDGYSTLILNSPGGTPLVALRIAEDVSSRNVDIVVDGFCGSSCANYLAVAGKNLTVTCDSLVGWHGTLQSSEEAAIEMQAKGEPAELIKARSTWLANFHARERKYFKKVGVNYALLDDSVEIVREKDVTSSVDFTFDEITGDYTVSRSAAIWIPTIEIMQIYGIDTSGFCGQRTHDDIASALEKKGWNIPFASSGRVN